jgi:DNA-binding transcriptional regulator YiaG
MSQSNPDPFDIRKARANAGITQKKAAEMLHTSIRAYQQWEAGDRAMHPAFWELFLIKLETVYYMKDQ